MMYQVMQNIDQSLMVKEFIRYIGYSTPSKPLLISTINFNFNSSNWPMWLCGTL